ncbi:MmcQ/YjbR family DNA-binding protein [Streptococcus didelphis]|uniref:MmcQ/YjbR family DNA-binding protein n=1 Tax=Streptococcus didelphis TaxID=102886 RepID=UPI00036A7167|nr:MmcQ/YjbR family DNA-binding protein [Streptococcus didelphis]WMB29945.1 MmcQ/YjbR family DNA-binding protein [Streptococcus didelphis]
MSLISELFQKKTVDWKRLEDFGFRQDGAVYFYQQLIMDGDFQVLVSISNKEEVSARVIDLDLNEDYIAISVENSGSAYVKKVQKAYKEVLEKIARDCFISQPFMSAQMNRLSHKIAENFDDPLDYPFEKNPDCSSYRVAGKWYALIFPIEASKIITGSSKQEHRTVEIINLKVKTYQLDKLLQKKGIYPAYHMSKKSWVSIILDDNLNDQELWDLIEESRALVAPSNLTNPQGSDYWIIPANLIYYDIDAEFAANPEILWTQKASIKAGDFVFIYITAPTKAIRYACQVLEADIANEGYRKNTSIKTLMKLGLIKSYHDDQLPLEIMKEKGVRAVRGPRRMSKELLTYVKEKAYFNDRDEGCLEIETVF